MSTRPLVVALDREDVRHAEALEHVAHMRLAQDPAHAGKQRGEFLGRRKYLLMIGAVEIIDEGGAGNLDDDRLCIAGFQPVHRPG